MLDARSLYKTWDLQSRASITINAYIIGQLQPFTLLMLCALIFYVRSEDLQFNVDYEQQIFEKFCMASSFTLRVFARNPSLTSHTTHVVCINFIHKWRDLQFNVVAEQ